MSSRTSAMDYDVQKIAAALSMAAQQFDSQMRKIDSYRKRSEAGSEAGLLARLNRAFARPSALPRGVDAALTAFDTSLGYLTSIEADCGHMPPVSGDAESAERHALWLSKSADVRDALVARVRDLPQWQAYQSKAAARGLTAEVSIVQRAVPTAVAGNVLHEDVMVLRLPLPPIAAVAAMNSAPRYTAAHAG